MVELSLGWLGWLGNHLYQYQVLLPVILLGGVLFVTFSGEKCGYPNQKVTWKKLVKLGWLGRSTKP